MNLSTLNDNPFLPLVLTAFAAMFLCLGTYPLYIRWLKAKQISQYIREEGPKSHAAKAKTPTMGGLCFIFSIVVVAGATLFIKNDIAAEFRNRALLALLTPVLCGLIGFADDYGKITSKSNAGISAKLRLLLEFGLGAVLGCALYYMHLMPDFVYAVELTPDGILPKTIPHFTGILEMVYVMLFVPFLMAATSNALNLHDGMDGLAGGTSCVVFITLAIMLFAAGHWPLAWVASTAAGALLGFLFFNKNPAKVFMGDTGSLFIGALMASLVVCGGLVIWFVPLSIIYIVEAVSVMAQVAYFKLTKPYDPPKPMDSISLAIYKLTHRLPGDGKRLLRMAPVHHHFEAIAAEKGIKEWEVVVYFWLAQIAISSICILFFRLGQS